MKRGVVVYECSQIDERITSSSQAHPGQALLAFSDILAAREIPDHPREK
jgi:hypothetical protein